MIKFINNLNISSIYIPLGMYRSVEWNNDIQTQHPVRDASLAECTEGRRIAFFTEICIPTEYHFRNSGYMLFIFR